MKLRWYVLALFSFLALTFRCGIFEPEAPKNGSLRIVLVEKAAKNALHETTGSLQSIEALLGRGSNKNPEKTINLMKEGNRFKGEFKDLEPANDYWVLLYGRDGNDTTIKSGYKSGIPVRKGKEEAVNVPWGDFIPTLETYDGSSFKWRKVDGATAYHLQVASQGDFSTSIVDKDTLTSTEYPSSAPVVPSTYEWRVSCKDNRGRWGAWSDSSSFTISPTINIDVSTNSVEFGIVNIGQSKDETVTITNLSISTAPLDGGVSISGNGFSIVSGDGSFSLSPGQSKAVIVRFTPTSSQSHNGNLKITHNATNQPNTIDVSLSGGACEINIDVSPPSIDFGPVVIGQSQETTVTIRNLSTSNCSLTGGSTISGNGFSIVSGSGSFDLSPGQSRTITIRLTPTSNQTYNGNLRITHNATNESSPIDVPLSGVPCQINIEVSPTSVDFGDVVIGESKESTVIISNLSTSNCSLTGSVSISGSGFSIVSGGGSFSLSPGQSSTITVRFNPTSNQIYNGNLSITHNATSVSSPIDVPLSGSGILTGPVAFYPFNGNANDESGNGNNGTVNGATLATDRKGNTKSAYEFDGIDDYIEMQHNPIGTIGGGNYSFNLWFKPDNVAKLQNFLELGKDITGVNDEFTSLGLSDSKLRGLAFFRNFNEIILLNGQVNNSLWQMATFVRNQNNWDMYLNGELVGNGTHSGIFSNEFFDKKMVVGASTHPNSRVEFDGLIDELSIWSRAITNEEIQQLYQQGKVEPPPNDMLAFYPFNGNANDESGNGYHGETRGGPTLTIDRFGNQNSAYSFDGVDDYIYIPANGALSFDASTESYTVSAFFYVDSLGNAMAKDLYVIQDREIGTNSWKSHGLTVITQATNVNKDRVNCGIYNGFGKMNPNLVSSGTVSTHQWYHAAMVVKAGQSMELYIDGQLDNSLSIAGLTNTKGNTGGITIGAGYFPDGIQIFNGIIDDVRIYDRALTGTEINALYNAQ